MSYCRTKGSNKKFKQFTGIYEVYRNSECYQIGITFYIICSNNKVGHEAYDCTLYNTAISQEKGSFSFDLLEIFLFVKAFR